MNRFSTDSAISDRISTMKSTSLQRFCRSLLRAAFLALLLIAVQPISTAYAETLREAAERVARQNDAKVVSAREVTDRNGRKVYVIRILTRDGVVRTIRVPARGAEQEWNLLVDVSLQYRQDDLQFPDIGRVDRTLLHWSQDREKTNAGDRV